MEKTLRYIIIIMVVSGLAMLAWPRLVWAQEPLVLTDSRQAYPLGGSHVAYLEDSSRQLTLEQVMALDAGQWQISPDAVPSLGYTNSAYWFRFELTPQVVENNAWFLDIGYQLEDITLYRFSPISQQWQAKQTGRNFPIASRELPNQRFVFKLDIFDSKPQMVYLRVENHGSSLVMPLTLASFTILYRQDYADQLWLGFYMGVLVILVSYNLFLGLSLWDTNYGYYVVMLIGFLLNTLVERGTGQYYFWGQWPYLTYYLDNLSMGLTMMGALSFTRSFLLTATQARRINYGLLFLTGSFLTITLLRFVVVSPILIAALVMTAMVSFVSMFLTASYMGGWLGYRPARYFLLAWWLLLGTILLFIGSRAGGIATTALTEHGFEWGVMFMGLMFSFALADRVKILEQERLQAQHETIRLTGEYNLALKEANESLEQRVQQRTEQLEQQAVELREARIKADSANQAKSDFLSAMSHELRTPLNGILGYAQILRRKLDLNSEMLNGLNVIYQSGNHLLTLINDILDLSKVEARKMELHPESVHLTSFLESVVGIIYMRAREKGLAFKQEFKSLPLAVMVDEKRLRQVLLNLLGNAVKFTAAGAVTLRVSEVARVRSGESANESETSRHLAPSHSRHFGHSLIRFEVEDSGVGIAGHELEKIFQPFEQTGHVRQRSEGTGLGLAISRQLVELMGGTIQVKSELGQGSLFWFELTLPLGEASDTLLKPSVVSHQIKGYQGETRRVLVVDDAASNRYLLRALLEPLGFEIMEAENGAVAFNLTLQFRPDLIITDVVMPEITGFELIEKVRAMPDLAATHVIVVSASSFDMREKTVVVTAYDGYLNKPIDVDKLLELMGQALGLEWLYEAEVIALEQPTIMVALPHDGLVELHQYVKEGNMRKVRQKGEALLIQLGAEYHPFINQVLELARGYEEKKLRALLEQYLS